MSTRNRQVIIPETEVQIISSSNVNQEFNIFIALPQTYAKDNKKAYPVLYVIEGNSVFGIVTETVRLFDLFNELQEIIIVGIGYPDVNTFKATMGFKTRDLTPTKADWYEKEFKPLIPDAPKYAGEGEATKFLQFISEELIPLINKNYRTLPEDNSLMGFSFGGLFTLYALFNQPDVFKRYIVGSPSVWWDDNIIISLEKEFASKNDDLAAWLFMSVGGQEPEFMISDMYKMANTLKSRQYKSLKMVTHFFNGEGHMSVIPAFISRSLRVAFAQNS